MAASRIPRIATLAALLLWLVLGSLATAQTSATTAPDYDSWEGIATRAEQALDETDTVTGDLTALRDELSGWRAQFLEAQNINRDRIATLKAQRDALGPAPDSGSDAGEPDAIASRRAELTDQLNAAEAPRVRALEAYNRSNGLIQEIDDVVRTRQTEALLEAVPLPVNPANWPPALETLSGVASEIASEVSGAFSSADRRQVMLSQAPVALALVVGAVLLLARGRIWMTQITDWVQGRRRQHGRLFMGFLISITQVLVPLVGIFLLLIAIASLGVVGDLGLRVVRALMPFATIVYGALWLANRVFTPDPTIPTLFDLNMPLRRGLRRNAILVGVLMGIWSVVQVLNGLERVDPAEAAVFNLPVIVLLSYAFWRVGRLLRRAVSETSGEEAPGFALWLVGILGRALAFVALAAPLIAVSGYNALAGSIVFPTGATLWMIGLFVTLQWPIRDIYATITRTDVDKAGDALIPVLINFAVLILAMPALALAWGMRPEQLSELGARVAEGITLGETRLTPGVVFTVLFVFAIGYMLTRFLQSALKTTVLPRTRLDAGARNAVHSFVGYVGVALAVLFAINAGGIDLTALGYIFGALSVGIGFGLQNVVQNFVAGIILLIERPIGEGDWIEVGGQMGIVKSISVRSTTIETFDKQEVIVPNADFIAGTVTNWTRGSEIGRAMVEVGVAYGTDTRRVEAILQEIAREHPVVAHYPEPGVDFMGFGASSLDFRIRMILRDVNRLLDVQTEVRHRIAERFAEEGIEIPFAQHDIWLRTPEAVDARPKPAATAPGRPPSTEGPESADDGDGDADR